MEAGARVQAEGGGIQIRWRGNILEVLKFDRKLTASFVIVLVSIIIPITNRNSQLYKNLKNM